MKSIRINQFINLNKNTANGSLSERVIRGGFWVFALHLTNRGFGIVRKVVLARLLAPEDFGLLGIAFLAMSTLETFSQTGFQAALVQKRTDIKTYLDTAWTVSAMRGVILFGFLFFSAPLVAEFFNSPRATLIIRVIGVTVLFSGLSNIGIIFFQKELEFKNQFFYHLSGTLTNFGVAIVLALLLKNVWALVWGGVAASFVQLFISYIVHPYRPRFKFEKAKFDQLFGFGKWVVGSGVLIFLITHGDDILVGKVLGATALGLYQMAYMISNMPATEISHVISQVTFPAYSKIKIELKRLTDAYLKVLKYIALASMPLSAGILICANDFTELLLGEKWLPMVPAMQVLALCGGIRSIGATTGPVFRAIGRPNIELKLHGIRLFVLTIFIFPLIINWGLLGSAFAFLLSTSISHLLADYLLIKELSLSIKKFVKILITPTVGTVIMSGGLIILRNAIALDFRGRILVLVVTGIVLYIFTIGILEKIIVCNSKSLREIKAWSK